jgi:lysophospholipase L1-like esterase
MIRRAVPILCVALAALAGCKTATPTTPTPPVAAPPVVVTPTVPAAPSITCPSPVSSNTTAASVAITYPEPAVEGGQAPLSTSCTPPSGSLFSVGSREVSCSATDALNRSASCVFAVTVGRIPTLTKVKFLAFGDSITVGITSAENPSPPPFYLLTEVGAAAYPSVLQRLLAARYTAQTITVQNEGKGGERAQDGIGRAQSAINGARPEVVLIMDGYNDLGVGDAGIEPGIAAIGEIAKDARFRGARVFIATLTPPPIGVNRGIGNTTISRFNERLRDLARGENAVLVDVYSAWLPNPNLYNSADGRHPNEAGFRKIAEAFFDAIRVELESR